MADVKALVSSARTTRFDGASGISPTEYAAIRKAYQESPPSADTMKWLEKQNPTLASALRSDLDYNGFTGTSIGALNPNSEISPQQSSGWKPDNRPAMSSYRDGRPPNLKPGDPIGTHNGDKMRVYDTGGNKSIIGESVLNVSDADAQKSRGAQSEFVTKMSGAIGAPVSNPPSAAAARAYFQQMADKGASQDQIKAEYGRFNETFYKHAGGGVTWQPKLDPKDVDRRFGEQPIAKDGKRIIDCEGYSALTENVLGGIKGKDGKPMFEVQHAVNGTHITTGVFPRGGDPRSGFVVDNGQPRDIPFNPASERDFRSGSHDAQQRFLMRNYMGEHHGDSTVREYGSSMVSLAPPGMPKMD